MRQTARRVGVSVQLLLCIAGARHVDAQIVTVTAQQLPAGPWIAAAGSTTPALRYVSLVAEGGDVAVKLVPQTCVGRTSGNIAAVAPPAETKLSGGLTTVLTLTVTGLTQPDTYDALLSLRTATEPPREIAPIRLQIHAVPFGIASPPPKSIARVSQHAGGRWLSRALFQSEAWQDAATLTVDYGTPTPMPVRSWNAYATGATSGRVLTTRELITNLRPPRGEGGALVIPLQFDLRTLGPDNYAGHVLLSAGAPNDRPLSVPFDLAVRAGPLVPLLLVLLGILLGFFAAYMEREANRRAALMARLDRASNDPQQRSPVIAHVANGDLAAAEVALRNLEGAPSATRVRDRVASALSGVPVEPQRWMGEASPLLYILSRVLVVLLLAYAGISAVYLSNLTFGAAGASDYLALVLWGLGADVTSKTLANVTPLLPRR